MNYVNRFNLCFIFPLCCSSSYGGRGSIWGRVSWRKRESDWKGEWESGNPGFFSRETKGLDLLLECEVTTPQGQHLYYNKLWIPLDLIWDQYTRAYERGDESEKRRGGNGERGQERERGGYGVRERERGGEGKGREERRRRRGERSGGDGCLWDQFNSLTLQPNKERLWVWASTVSLLHTHRHTHTLFSFSLALSYSFSLSIPPFLSSLCLSSSLFISSL